MWQSQKLLGDDLHPGRSTSSCTRCARGATTRSTSRARTLVRGPVLESEPEGKYDQQRLACSQNKAWRKAGRWGDLCMKKSRHATPHLFLTTCSGQELKDFEGLEKNTDLGGGVLSFLDSLDLFLTT